MMDKRISKGLPFSRHAAGRLAKLAKITSFIYKVVDLL
jgi:hypothetical protein